MPTFSSLKIIFLSAITLTWMGPLRADVTSEVFVKNSGYNGFGAHEATTVRKIQDTKSREDSDWKLTGKVLKLFAGRPREGTHIVRVDLDKIWTVNAKNKTYTERPIKLPAPKNNVDKTSATENNKPSEDKPTHRVKKTSFDMKRTGQKKTINGFNTEESLMTARIEVEEIATQEVTTYQLETRLWLSSWTPALKQLAAEERKFAQAYLAKLGLAFSTEDKQALGMDQVTLMLGLGSDKTEEFLKQIKTKMAGVDGYPILTESHWNLKEDPKAIERRKANKMEQEKSETSDTGNLGSNPTDIASGLLGGFAKKKMKEQQAKKEAAQENKPVLSIITEVKSVLTSKLAPADFDLPAGYKLRK